jgi:hypothetical protein
MSFLFIMGIISNNVYISNYIIIWSIKRKQNPRVTYILILPDNQNLHQ